MKHPTLTLLGAPVETSDTDFADLAFADTILGAVGFTRMTKNDEWVWHLTTWQKQIDDFGTLDDDTKRPVGLAAAVARAQRSLEAILKRAHSAPSPLEALAQETAAAARRTIRNDFQARWGRYAKCSKCGGRVGIFRAGHDGSSAELMSLCHSAPIIENGYAPPPKDPK